MSEPEVKLLTITTNAERVIEHAGRICYESFDKVGKDSHKKIIRHLIKSGHDSVLEHATVGFEINNVTRALMSQLTRHRIASYSIQSLRYVDKSNITKGFDKRYFDTIDSKDKAYILGLLFSDGNIYINEESGHYIVSIKLQSSDSWILYKIKSLIGVKSKIHFYEEEGSEGTHKLQFGCKDMVNTLISKYGLVPNKSKIIRADKVLEHIPKKLHRHFLLGVFDGDGSVGVAKRSASDVFGVITSYSDEFLKDLREHFPILATQPIKYHAIKFQGKNKLYKFLDYLYSDLDFANDMFLVRKFTKSIDVSTEFYEKYKHRILGDKFIIPPSILNEQKALAIYYEHGKLSFAKYLCLRMLNINKEDSRMLLPISTTSHIVVTMNFRSLRNLFDLRGEAHAQWEIRRMAIEMFNIVKEYAPNVFQDYRLNAEKEELEKIQI